ncbi:Lipase (class 3) [Seminavis robusta]|uniref:sn-1-specific diacylglycerol lipase n=1 Tax=Seminavis robusta TaxID=568900 RepID=A0A9N8E0Y4_9STRA|nr:Lipase (class 3) [Seminavis robusta]|eukprot:Sro538_g162640.1 Lipase (class 3) (485) ;mRNA; f:42590-44172
MSSSSSSIVSTTTSVVAVVSTTLLVYLQWRNAPEWIKQGLWSNSSSDSDGANTRNDDLLDKDANDDLASLPAVMDKLKQMYNLVSAVSDDVEQSNWMGDWQLMAAFYSLLHLNTELLAKDPDYRDKLYDDHHHDDDVELEEVLELAKYLDYAQWAYLSSHTELSKNCRHAGLDLMTHDTATEPGRVAHYIALQHSQKLAIIGLKGTNTFSDIMTDLIALPKKHAGCHFDNGAFAKPKSGDKDPVNEVYCHEGIFTAAIWMADAVQPMIENMLVPLNYKVIICGHSLGAGTACLLGLELRSRIAAFRENTTDLRVLAFATPPVISYKAARACEPFVTSVVNNTDVVCRCSVSNLIIMYKLLNEVTARLNAKGLTLDSWTSIQNYYKEHSVVDDDLLMTEEELDTFFEETHADPEKDDQALYVPGRCVVMWDKGENDDFAMGGIVTDGGMKMLRQVELALSFITDHIVPSYRTSLQKLIQQKENTI